MLRKHGGFRRASSPLPFTSAIDEHEINAALPGIPFWELREGRCKFPLGRLSNLPERFCGAPAAISSP